ncbi:uncharacterized protein CEXT_668481, partial [Caerostris extrusa]
TKIRTALLMEEDARLENAMWLSTLGRNIFSSRQINVIRDAISVGCYYTLIVNLWNLTPIDVAFREFDQTGLVYGLPSLIMIIWAKLPRFCIQCAAEKAGLISMQQFNLALRLGDPLTICRCKIYLAMSLLQKGYYQKTKKLIRELYKFSIGTEGLKDFRLKNMCIAVWNRLKYELSQKAISAGSQQYNIN